MDNIPKTVFSSIIMAEDQFGCVASLDFPDLLLFDPWILGYAM